MHNYGQVVRETGPPHMRMFVTRCKVGDLECEGEGNGKKVNILNSCLQTVIYTQLVGFSRRVSEPACFGTAPATVIFNPEPAPAPGKR